MQNDHRVPTKHTNLLRDESRRKRSHSSGNVRKRNRHDLICVVCHAPAMGYNFDQITCESCKAFFRRNAPSNGDRFKCRAGTDNCLITLETRKRCKSCRLKKCFEKGLRKEWIMSEEEKRSKKQKIEDNRRLRALSQKLAIRTKLYSTPSTCSPPTVPETETFHYPVHINDHDDVIYTFDSHSDCTNSDLCSHSIIEPSFDYKTFLNSDDQITISKIEDVYSQSVRYNISEIRGFHSPCLRHLCILSDLINELIQINALRMITFFKLTPEFNSLHEDDRLALVKDNLMTVFFLHTCICTNPTTEIYRQPQIPGDYCYRLDDLRLISDDIYQQTFSFIIEIHQLLAMDHIVIKLIILVMIFSTGSDSNQSIYLHNKQIFQAQNVYLQLLWNYLDARFQSEQTASIFSRLIFSCMKAQTLARQTKEIVSELVSVRDQLAPLMQSVLWIC